MTVTERVAYLRGLVKGMELDTDSKEGRAWTAVLDTLDEAAAAIQNLQQRSENLSDELDELYEELTTLEEGLLEHEAAVDSTDSLYQVICPTCGEVICMDDELLREGSMVCPTCGEELEFDLSELKEEELPPAVPAEENA